MDFHPGEADGRGEPGVAPAADAPSESSRSPLASIAALVGDATKIAGGVLAALLVAFAAFFVWNQTRSTLLVVDPVDVPEAWPKAGITGDGVTHQLIHDIEYIQSIARYVPSKNDVSGSAERNATPAKELPDIELPEAKVSLQSLSHAIRGLLNISTDHVSIAIRGTERSAKYRLSMALSEDSVHTWVFRQDDLDATLQQAADTVVGHLDPAILGIYVLQALHDTTRARDLAYRALGGTRRDGDALAYWLIGAIAEAQHDDDGAMTALRQALAHNPRFAQAYLWWGLTAEHAGRLAEARRIYEAAARADPSNGWAFADAGNALWRSVRDPAARRWYLNAIGADPTTDVSYLGLGDLAFYGHHRMAEARQWYVEALARSAGPANWNALANLEVQQGNMEGADSDYANALVAHDVDADAQLGLTFVNLTRGRYADAACNLAAARSDVDQALAMDSSDVFAYSDLAQVYDFAQLPALAAGVLGRAIQTSPEELSLYIQAGDMWGDYGDSALIHGYADSARAYYLQADGWYNVARGRAPKAIEPALGLAYDREKLPDSTEAIRQYTDVLHRDDRATTAVLGLAAERHRPAVRQWVAHIDSIEFCNLSGSIYTDACRESNLAEQLAVARAVDSLGDFGDASARFANITTYGPPNGRAEALLGRDLSRLSNPVGATFRFHRADSLGFREQWMYAAWQAAAQSLYGSDSAHFVERLGARRLKEETERRRRFLAAATQPPRAPLKGYVVSGASGCRAMSPSRN